MSALPTFNLNHSLFQCTMMPLIMGEKELKNWGRRKGFSIVTTWSNENRSNDLFNKVDIMLVMMVMMIMLNDVNTQQWWEENICIDRVVCKRACNLAIISASNETNEGPHAAILNIVHGMHEFFVNDHKTVSKWTLSLDYFELNKVSVSPSLSLFSSHFFWVDFSSHF